MTKFILLPTGMSMLWLYQNISPETWLAISATAVVLALGLMALLIWGQSNRITALNSHVDFLSSELATVQHQLDVSEERRKILGQPRTRRTRASMRRGKVA